MSPDVILLFGHLFFDLPQTDDLTRLAFFSWNGLLDHSSELQSFLAVPVQCLSLQFLSLGLILHKLLVPVLVELIHFLMMSCLNFPLLLLKSSHQLVPSLFFQFYLQLCQSFLDGLCLHVLPCFLAGLLLGEEHLPEL